MFDFAAARDTMVDSQVRTNDVTDYDIQTALREIARERFLPASKQAVAYSDAHVKTDEGRYMIRPRDFSKMVQAADIKPTDIVLDIACGRGYSTAVLARLAETVVGLEETDAAVDLATENLSKTDTLNAAVVKGDLKAGAPDHGPFDVIFVNGAVHDVPKSWLDQMSHGGRLIVVRPEDGVGQAHLYTKVGDNISQRIVFDAQMPVLPGFTPAPGFVF